MIKMKKISFSHPDSILTTGRIAQFCGVDPRTVTRWIQQGILRSHMLPITKFKRVKTADFVRFLKEQKMPIPPELADFGKVRVLIVDDDIRMAKSIQRMLLFSPKDRFKCDIATGGFEAGLKLQKNKPDAVIVDLMMPRVNGFRVCKVIRSNPETQHIKILAISGLIEKQTRQKISEIGADDFLEKPFDEETLRQRLTHLLQGDGRT